MLIFTSDLRSADDDYDIKMFANVLLRYYLAVGKIKWKCTIRYNLRMWRSGGLILSPKF